MAAAPTKISPITTNENTDPNLAADPFWDSTPRTVSLLPEIMLSIRQAVPAPPGNTPRASRTPAPAARRPQCTHITMNRLYGNHRCHICNRVPDVGFVYSCKFSKNQVKLTGLTTHTTAGQQDRFLQHDHSVPSTEALPVVADNINFFEAQAKVAESIGMSASVIKQMRAAAYTYDQIEKLLQQRRHVLEVIRKAESASTQSSLSPSPRKDRFQSAAKPEQPPEVVIASSGLTNAPAVQPVPGQALPMTPAGTPTNTPAISTTTTPNAGPKVTCNFQVCHACRPFFTDRLHSSIDAVYNDEIPPISPEDESKLRVLDANVVNRLGLRPTLIGSLIPPREYDMSRLRQGDGYDDDESPGCTPTDTSISDGSLYLDAHNGLPCPGRGYCNMWDDVYGCGWVTGRWNDEPNSIMTSKSTSPRQRSITTATPGGTSSAGSSISLPAPKTEPLTPPTPEDFTFDIDRELYRKRGGRAATVCGVLSKDGQYRDDFADSPIQNEDAHSSDSSFGSEVEVDGGVALTEEAVERGVPDIASG